MGRYSEGWRIWQHKTGYWYVRFTHEGRRTSKSTRCREKGRALDAAAKIYASAIAGFSSAQKPTGELSDMIAGWLVALEDDGKSAEWIKTCDGYARAHWEPRWRHLAEISEAACRDYIRSRRRSVAPTSVRKELSALRSLLKWCKDEGDIDHIPDWEAPQGRTDFKPEWLTHDEMVAVLAKLPTRNTHRQGHPVQEFYTIMWATSFRLGTMARLRWEDVNLADAKVTVRPSADKKRHGREVALTENAVEAFRGMGPGVGLVFGQRNYLTSLRKAAREAGIGKERAQKVGNHSIRHSRLTDLASKSKNIAAIRQMAGHRDLASTMRYVHGSLEMTRDLLQETGDLNGDLTGSNHDQLDQTGHCGI